MQNRGAAADGTGRRITTVTHDTLAKVLGVGKDLDEHSLDAVAMFQSDVSVAGCRIEAGSVACRTLARQKINAVTSLGTVVHG